MSCRAMWSLVLLAHLSRRLKRAFLITIGLLSVLVIIFSNFLLLLQSLCDDFNPTWHKASLVKETLVCSNEGPWAVPREDNNKRVKTFLQNLKVFSRTTGPISTKLDTQHPWVKRIQVCSNGRALLFLWGNCSERSKL